MILRIPGTGWRVDVSSLVSIRWERGTPRLLIAIGFGPIVKWGLQVLFVVGAIVSAVSFSRWYVGVGVYLVLALINAFLGRTIFQYAIPFMQPFPKFDYRPSRWRGMGFAFPNHDPRKLAMFGPAMSSVQEAIGLFDLFREWNDGAGIDINDNIRVSIIFENPGAYSVYIYPSITRKAVIDFFEDARKNYHPRDQRVELHEHVVQFTMHKVFPYGLRSSLDRFIAERQQGLPFWLFPFKYSEVSGVELSWDTEPILKHHLKVRRREDLEPGDVEYNIFWRGKRPFA